MKSETAKIYDLLFKRFVGKISDRYMLAHIAHENGFLYASNGHILAKVKMDYPKEREGKTFRNTGSFEKSTVNYEKTIPIKRDGDYYISSEEVERIKTAARKVWRTKINGQKVVINIGLPTFYYDYQDCYMTFRAEYLDAAFRLFEIRNELPAIRISTSTVMVLESETITVLIMPVMVAVTGNNCIFPMLTVQEAIDFKKQERNKFWYER